MDKDEILDSITHNEERAAKMRAEAEETARIVAIAEAERKAHQIQREQVARNAHADELEGRAGLIGENETREMLLDRIRKMRELDKPVEVAPVFYLSPEQKAVIELEQKAGREAVAKAEAEQERIRVAKQNALDREQANMAVTIPVHHPNPDQSEQYPAVKATLGKPHDRAKTK